MDTSDLLEEHSDEIAGLAHRLLDHIAAATDWADTRVYPGWHGIGFHHAGLGYVVGVFPRADTVRVLFEHGHLLGAAPFLEGSGQTRYVEFADWDVDRVATVDDMLDRALAL